MKDEKYGDGMYLVVFTGNTHPRNPVPKNNNATAL